MTDTPPVTEQPPATLDDWRERVRGIETRGSMLVWPARLVDAFERAVAVQRTMKAR